MAGGAIKAKSGYEKLRKAILYQPEVFKFQSRSRLKLPDDLPPLLSPNEVAELLGLRRATVVELVRDGEMGPYYDFRTMGVKRGLLRIPREGVVEFLRAAKAQSGARHFETLSANTRASR